MKWITVILLSFLSLSCLSQDWTINVTHRYKWTRLKLDGEDGLYDTTYRCRIVKDSGRITIYSGRHKAIFAYDEIDPPETWWATITGTWWALPPGGIAYHHHGDVQGVFIYYPKGIPGDPHKRLIRWVPRELEYVYY